MVRFTTIRISEDLHRFLSKNITHKKQNFETIIWNLIGMEKLSREQTKDYKKGKESYLKYLEEGS